MADSQPELSGRRILVCEDEFFIADEIAASLTNAGAEVVGPCPTVRRALDLLESEGGNLDAALLDVHLRGETTDVLAGKLRSRGVPIVLATGYDRPALEAGLRDLPRCDKPINVRALVRTLAEMTRRAS